MLTSNKNIDKKESLQNKAIRLLIGLPRISHTAEAFWALNILPFRKLGIFNVINFLFQLKGDQLPPTFKKDFILSKNIKNANLRNRNDFYIPRIKSFKIGLTISLKYGMKINDTFLSFQISILFRILNRI